MPESDFYGINTKCRYNTSIFIVIMNHKNSLFHLIKPCKPFRVKPIFRNDCSRKLKPFTVTNLKAI